MYVSKRTRDWLKFKCTKEQEFVIGGYTDPKGHRIGFGALLVGYYKGRKLV
jgi:bifunctional non-homologous end joining protein LigD